MRNKHNHFNGREMDFLSPFQNPELLHGESEEEDMFEPESDTFLEEEDWMEEESAADWEEEEPFEEDEWMEEETDEWETEEFLEDEFEDGEEDEVEEEDLYFQEEEYEEEEWEEDEMEDEMDWEEEEEEEFQEEEEDKDEMEDEFDEEDAQDEEMDDWETDSAPEESEIIPTDTRTIIRNTIIRHTREMLRELDRVSRRTNSGINPAKEFLLLHESVSEDLTRPLKENEWKLVEFWLSRGKINDSKPLTADSKHNASLTARAILCHRMGKGNSKLLHCLDSEISKTDPRVRKLEQRVTAKGSIINWAQVDCKERILYVMNLLVNTYKYPAQAAAGIVGNLLQESHVLPNFMQGATKEHPMLTKTRVGKKCPRKHVYHAYSAEEALKKKPMPCTSGIGIAQWTFPSRRVGLFKHDKNLRAAILFNMDAQVDYMVTELRDDTKPSVNNSYKKRVNNYLLSLCKYDKQIAEYKSNLSKIEREQGKSTTAYKRLQKEFDKLVFPQLAKATERFFRYYEISTAVKNRKKDPESYKKALRRRRNCALAVWKLHNRPTQPFDNSLCKKC
jgi:hypothetical protein